MDTDILALSAANVMLIQNQKCSGILRPDFDNGRASAADGAEGQSGADEDDADDGAG